MTILSTPSDALRLLTDLGAPPWLVRHHELVVEAAILLCNGLERAFPDLRLGRNDGLLGAAPHDVGKLTTTAFRDQIAKPAQIETHA